MAKGGGDKEGWRSGVARMRLWPNEARRPETTGCRNEAGQVAGPMGARTGCRTDGAPPNGPLSPAPCCGCRTARALRGMGCRTANNSDDWRARQATRSREPDELNSRCRCSNALPSPLQQRFSKSVAALIFRFLGSRALPSVLHQCSSELQHSTSESALVRCNTSLPSPLQHRTCKSIAG